MPHEVPVDCHPFVLGLAHGQSGQCGFIRDSDMQAACRARFG
jgi:hypothetical protein